MTDGGGEPGVGKSNGKVGQHASKRVNRDISPKCLKARILLHFAMMRESAQIATIQQNATGGDFAEMCNEVCKTRFITVPN